MKNLRNELWESIQLMKSGQLDPKIAEVMAKGCNGIMRSVKLELDILNSFGQLEPDGDTLMGIGQKVVGHE